MRVRCQVSIVVGICLGVWVGFGLGVGIFLWVDMAQFRRRGRGSEGLWVKYL